MANAQLHPVTFEIDDEERAAVLAAQEWTPTIRVLNQETNEEHEIPNPVEADSAIQAYYDKATTRAVDEQIRREERAGEAERVRERQQRYREKKKQRKQGVSGG